jgi:arabinofuranosyltransferase
MNKTKIVILICILAYFAILNFLRLNYLHTTILDDAYIFLRYAENFVNGYGFVWNIHEAPVEGYTSFLYLVILILVKFLSIDLESFAIIFGIITSAFTIFFGYLIYDFLYSKRLSKTSSVIFSIIILAISPAYLYWSAAGMETSFYSMFLLLTFYLFIKLPGTSKSILFKGVMFGLLCVLRFEAVLFFIAALYYLSKKDNSFFKIKIDKGSLLFVIGFAIIFGAYFIWRWSYFGYFFPNTFYAKTGGGFHQIAGGFLYVIKAMRLFYGFGWIPIIFVFLFFRKNMLTKNGIFLFSIGIISLLTSVFIGGDHFHYGRFVLPVLPLLFIFLPPAFERMSLIPLKYLNLKPSYRSTIIILFISVLLVVKPVYQETISGFINLFGGKKGIIEAYDISCEEEIIDWQTGFIIMGSTLKQIAKKDDYIAAVPIGAIGYYSKINVIDMVGIVDPVIAHEKLFEDKLKKWTPGHTKGDGNYILSREPKYIQLTDYLTRKPREIPHPRSLQFTSVKQIWESKEFHSDYEFYPIEVIDGWYYNLFRRKE